MCSGGKCTRSPRMNSQAKENLPTHFCLLQLRSNLCHISARASCSGFCRQKTGSQRGKRAGIPWRPWQLAWYWTWGRECRNAAGATREPILPSGRRGILTPGWPAASRLESPWLWRCNGWKLQTSVIAPWSAEILLAASRKRRTTPSSRRRSSRGPRPGTCSGRSKVDFITLTYQSRCSNGRSREPSPGVGNLPGALIPPLSQEKLPSLDTTLVFP